MFNALATRACQIWSIIPGDEISMDANTMLSWKIYLIRSMGHFIQNSHMLSRKSLSMFVYLLESQLSDLVKKQPIDTCSGDDGYLLEVILEMLTQKVIYTSLNMVHSSRSKNRMP